MDKVTVSLSSFLSTKPFLYGLNKSRISGEIDLRLDMPSQVASKMTFGKVDVGLIPVASLDDLTNYKIISPFCVAAVGKCYTESLVAQVPLEFIDTILMDYQSRSTVLLTKILAKYFWRKNFSWRNSSTGFEKKSIAGTTAGILIGDRGFDFEKKFLYRFDLGEEWFKFTRLPFVFVVWAAVKDVSEQFIAEFNSALEFGLENISEIVRMEQSNYPGVNIHEYLTKNFNYKLDNSKKAGMERFLELADKLKPGYRDDE